jgi:NifB/MoaA-like Fe-S oxidoreductase
VFYKVETYVKLGAKVQVFPIKNDFFGETVTVAGLVTGGDIIAQLKGKDLPEILLVPSIMLKEFETVFLDGITIEKLEKELGKTVRVIAPDGESFARAFTK